MEMLVEGLQSMIDNIEEVGDEYKQYAEALGTVKENTVIALTITPDFLAFAIYPYITIDEEKLNVFFDQFDIFTEELPCLVEIQKQKFFGIDAKESEFIRSIIAVDEVAAVKILFAIAWVRAER